MHNDWISSEWQHVHPRACLWKLCRPYGYSQVLCCLGSWKSYMPLVSLTHSVKHLHQNRERVYTLIERSITGGHITRRETPSHQATSSSSNAPCKANQNPLAFGKSTLIVSCERLVLSPRLMNLASTTALLMANESYSSTKMMTLLAQPPTKVSGYLLGHDW